MTSLCEICVFMFILIDTDVKQFSSSSFLLRSNGYETLFFQYSLVLKVNDLRFILFFLKQHQLLVFY